MSNFSDPKNVAEAVLNDMNLKRISEDNRRYLIWNGAIKDIIKDSIKKEFIKKETIEDMIHRVIPLNITGKIIDKLSQVYKEPPLRRPVDENPSDQDLINLFVKEWDMNRKMKFYNKMFKLHKNSMLEPFVKSNGEPGLRVMPSYTYTVLSDDPIDPTVPTHVVKHLIMDRNDPNNDRFAVWSNDFHYIINRKGEIDNKAMNAMGNTELINPYGILPFTYIKDSEDRLVPISDDDLISMQIAICLLLTDLAFGSKYQVFSLIALMGAGTEELTFNPNSIISLPVDAKIQVIKPQIDIDAMLRQIQANLGMLLSTKGLRVGDTGGTLTIENAVSGVSKMMDNAEVVEIREDQVSFFRAAEEDFWYKFAHRIHPIWVKNKSINPDYAKLFSEDFELSIFFPDLKQLVSVKERIENAKAKEEAGYITRRMAIKEVDPDIEDEQIEKIISDSNKDTLDRAEFMQRNMISVESFEPERESDGTDT